MTELFEATDVHNTEYPSGVQPFRTGKDETTLASSFYDNLIFTRHITNPGPVEVEFRLQARDYLG